MKSYFTAFLLFAFLSVFALKASDFHCNSPETHHHSHSSEKAYDEFEGHSHAGDNTKECPPHMHSCCTSVFLFQAESKFDLPVPLKIVFSENIYTLKPAPSLEGPFQPPRHS